MHASPPASRDAGQRLLLLTIAIGTILAPLNSTMIAVALPDIQQAFGVSVTSTAWLVTLYLIAMAVGQPIGGRLGDTFGRRPVYLAGLAWFAIASLGCALAPDLAGLVVFRLQQALAGTLIFPNGAALVREAVPAHRRGMAFGMIGLAASVAAASGPPVGGILVDLFGWAAIFWANVPFVALGLVLAWCSLPHRHRQARPDAHGGRFDIAGAGLLAASLSALILIPTLLKIDRPGLTVVTAIGGIAAVWGFVRWERRVRSPVVDVTLFARSHFAAACASILLGNLMMYTTLLALPLYLEGVRGESLRTTGLMLAAMSAFAAFSTPLGGRWMDRQGRWLPAVTGAVLVLAGTILLALATQMNAGTVLVIALVVLGLGLGIAGAPVQTAAVESVPESSAGAAAGIYSTSRYVGSAIGSSVLAMVFAQQPGVEDIGRFTALFAALAVVALAAVFTHANIALREGTAHHEGALHPQGR